MKVINMRSVDGHRISRSAFEGRAAFYTSKVWLLPLLCLLSLCSTVYGQGPESPMPIDMDYCAGEDVSLTTLYNSQWDYSWSVMKDGAVIHYVKNPSPDPNILVWTAPSPSEITAATDFIISVVVSDKSLTTCKNEDSETITIRPPPDCTIAADDPVCEESTGNMASTNYYEGASYVWTVDGESITPPDPLKPNEILWDAPDTAGRIQICVEITTEFGCISECCEEVTINPLPDCTITAPESVCEGSTGNMASAQFYAGATYVWTVDGVTVTPPNLAEPNKILWDAPIDAGSSEICVKIIDANGCECQDCVEVPFDPLPDCTITPPTEPICPGAKDLTASAAYYEGATYKWTVNGNTPIICGPATVGSPCNSITFDAPDAPGSTIPITLEITDAKGCTAYCEDYFYINDRPYCDIDYWPCATCTVICTGDTYTVSTTDLGAGAHYAWWVNGVAQNIDAPTLTLTAPNTPGYVNVCLVVTDPDGCQSEQCCVDVPIEACMTCETAWAYLETCINTARGSNNWGWFGTYSAAELEAGLSVPFIAAAGQCDPGKGYEVGTVTASLTPWDGTSQTLYVDVDLNSECELSDFHVWASSDPINNPIPTKGGFSKWNKDGEITFTSEVSEVLLAVHGSVCCPACAEGCVFPQ